MSLNLVFRKSFVLTYLLTESEVYQNMTVSDKKPLKLKKYKIKVYKFFRYRGYVNIYNLTLT